MYPATKLNRFHISCLSMTYSYLSPVLGGKFVCKPLKIMCGLLLGGYVQPQQLHDHTAANIRF